MREGLAAPLVWTGVGVFGTLAAAVAIGTAAYDSETAGTVATEIAALPAGFLWGAAIGAWIAFFAFRANRAGRIATPLGCGCVSAVGVAALVFVFFAAIFPEL